MKHRVGFIGFDGMGSGYHFDVAHDRSDVCDDLAPVAVYDVRESQRELARSRGVIAYDNLEDLLANDEIDVVVVATPNQFHCELTCKALEAGKHVVCEKPAAMSPEEFEKMVETSKRTGKLLFVHQNRRFDRDFMLLKHAIETDRLGKVYNINSNFCGGLMTGWRSFKDHGGGIFYDWGVHLIDQMLFLITSDIDTVSCTCTHITTDEVDDGFKLNIKFVDGKTAYIEVGTFNFIALPRFYMQCKNGTAIITDWREKAKVVKCKAWHENDVLPVQTAAGITKTMAPRDEITTDTYEVEKPQSDVHDYYRNLVKAIDGIEPALIQLSQVRRVMKVMEAAFKSDEQNGAPVKFDEKA